MKILLVCKSLPPGVSGGIQTHTWKLSEALVRLGHEVSILTAGSYKKGVQIAESGGRTLIELPYLPGRRLPLLGKWAEEWAFNVAARRWLRQYASAYDIVHLQGRSGFMAVGHTGQTPVIQTIHGLIGVENHHGKQTHWTDVLHQRWATYWERRALNGVHGLVAVSAETARNIGQLSAGALPKTSIISNGVGVPVQASEASEAFFLFIGRLCTIKGIFPLVKAMKMLPEHIRLVMIGDVPERQALERAIEAAGLQHRIQLTGALPQDVVFSYLQRAKALVTPSFFETQGIVLLEAGACAKAVIATAVGGIPEVVMDQENGLLVPPDDPAKLAEAMAYLDAHPEAAQRLGANGQNRVKALYSWEKVALETERFYGNVLAQHHKNITRQTGIGSIVKPAYVWATR